MYQETPVESKNPGSSRGLEINIELESFAQSFQVCKAFLLRMY